MVVLEPAAIRCGLLPRELWTMTPAEIITVIREKTKDKEDKQKFMDLLNGKNCAVNFLLHAPKSHPKPSDFMITQRGTKS
jgi:hypothetical protein